MDYYGVSVCRKRFVIETCLSYSVWPFVLLSDRVTVVHTGLAENDLYFHSPTSAGRPRCGFALLSFPSLSGQSNFFKDCVTNLEFGFQLNIQKNDTQMACVALGATTTRKMASMTINWAEHVMFQEKIRCPEVSTSSQVRRPPRAKVKKAIWARDDVARFSCGEENNTEHVSKSKWNTADLAFEWTAPRCTLNESPNREKQLALQVPRRERSLRERSKNEIYTRFWNPSRVTVRLMARN